MVCIGHHVSGMELMLSSDMKVHHELFMQHLLQIYFIIIIEVKEFSYMSSLLFLFFEIITVVYIKTSTLVVLKS